MAASVLRQDHEKSLGVTFLEGRLVALPQWQGFGIGPTTRSHLRYALSYVLNTMEADLLLGGQSLREAFDLQGEPFFPVQFGYFRVHT